MIDFLTIVLLIFGVLQIILFFKVRGMINDARDIRNKYLKEDDKKRRMEEDYNPTPKISKGIKPTTKAVAITPQLFRYHKMKANQNTFL